ncbi:lysozyme [Ralstonia insidiosa]|uniref:Lysozyme n=1 Tax=Ralstonia insidiosa TaxID=190721 RepID=A0A848NXQ8_9RALS|nr:lysozyme [Ralstonia insidiosa]NMV37256.1 lysozyme [Ralstonia insidiosa]
MPKMPPKPLAAIVGVAAAAGLFSLTPSFEGTVYHTYRDPIGVLTYCTGATENAQWGKSYSPAECRAQLDQDLARHAEGVMNCIKAPLTTGQKIAFVDLAYNVGVGAVCNSTLARKANAGDMAGACAELSKWTRAGGQVLPGLVRRRAAERDLCEGRGKA